MTVELIVEPACRSSTKESVGEKDVGTDGETRQKKMRKERERKREKEREREEITTSQPAPPNAEREREREREGLAGDIPSVSHTFSLRTPVLLSTLDNKGVLRILRHTPFSSDSQQQLFNFSNFRILEFCGPSDSAAQVSGPMQQSLGRCSRVRATQESLGVSSGSNLGWLLLPLCNALLLLSFVRLLRVALCSNHWLSVNNRRSRRPEPTARLLHCTSVARGHTLAIQQLGLAWVIGHRLERTVLPSVAAHRRRHSFAARWRCDAHQTVCLLSVPL